MAGETTLAFLGERDRESHTKYPESQGIIVPSQIVAIRSLDPKSRRDDGAESSIEQTKSGQYGVAVAIAENEFPLCGDYHADTCEEYVSNESLFSCFFGKCSAEEWVRGDLLPATKKKFPMKTFVTLTSRQPIRERESVVSVVANAPIAKAV